VQLLRQQQHRQADVVTDAEQQQQQQQQQDCAAQLLAALSNRAACWLSLEQYSSCINDCQAALSLALAEQQAAQRSDIVTNVKALDAANTTEATGAAADSGADAATAATAPAAASEQHVLQLLQQQSPEQLLALPAAGPARVRSTARLISRLAVAHGCLKDVQHAVQLYGLAQQWWLAVGDVQRAAEMAADEQRLQQLLPATQAA
jgi:hypothetical protein